MILETKIGKLNKYQTKAEKFTDKPNTFIELIIFEKHIFKKKCKT